MSQSAASSDVRRARLAFATAFDHLPFVWLDPHGENSANLLDYIVKFAAHRLGDVVNIDPGDKAGKFCLAYNPMAVRRYSDVGPARAIVMDILESQGLDKSNSRARPLASEAVQALLEANLVLSENNQMNLLHITPFFTNTTFRRLVMEFCTHQETRITFDPENGPYEVLGDKMQAEWSGPITRKISELASKSPEFARVFVSPTNKISLPHLLAANKCVILRLARFSAQKEMGEFLASALLPTVLHNMEVFGYRKDEETGEETGGTSRIFVDKCRIFFKSEKLCEVMEAGLFEARKFRAQHFLFGQQPGQLPASAQKALFGNTYAKLALLNSDPDGLNAFARSMRGPGGEITGADIAGLPPYHGYARFQMLKPDGTEVAVGPFVFAQEKSPDYKLRTEEEKASRQAVIDRSRAAHYNLAKDMDERRANYVYVVTDELEQRLAQRPSAVIPSVPGSGGTSAAPVQGAAPAGSARVAQPGAADIWAEPSDPHREALKTLHAIANGAENGDASEPVDVQLDDSGAFTGW